MRQLIIRIISQTDPEIINSKKKLFLLRWYSSASTTWINWLLSEFFQVTSANLLFISRPDWSMWESIFKASLFSWEQTNWIVIFGNFLEADYNRQTGSTSFNLLPLDSSDCNVTICYLYLKTYNNIVFYAISSQNVEDCCIAHYSCKFTYWKSNVL